MTKNYLWTDNPTEANVAVYDPDILNECLMHLKYNAKNPTPFCINSASVDASGLPNLLSYTGNTVNFNCGNSIVPLMTSNSQSGWTLSASHSINSISSDICKSFNNDSLNYCSIQHTPSVEEPAFIAIEKSTSFSFDYLYLKFNSVLNSGSIKTFCIKDEEGNLFYSYDNFDSYLDKDTFLIPIYNFNHTKLIISTNSNVNDADFVSFPAIIKLLNKSQIVSLTDAQGQNTLLSGISSLTLNTNGSYSVYLGLDGTFEALTSTLTSGKVLPSSPSVNQIHYLTSTEPAQAKVYNGSLWLDYAKVPAGKVTVASGVITSVSTNVYNQNGYNINTNVTLETGTSLAKSISNMSLPDYSKGIAKAWNTSHIASSDGWVAVYAFTNTALAYISIDGITFNLGDRSDNYGGGVFALIPVAKNSTYIATGGSSGQTVIFYPTKGTN